MFLGIDLGTSELKLLLLDERQQIVATVGEGLSVSRPQALWSEQDPAQWWLALDRAMGRLAARHAGAMARVRAIGLSGQMHGAVLIDDADRLLRPAILWNDGRSVLECQAMEATVPQLHAVAGNLAMPGFTAPKLWWVRTHEPEVHARTACVLLPKDWLRLQLSGERFTDMSDASGTLWLDVGRRTGSAALLAASGLRPSQMPGLVEGPQPAGQLRAEWAQRWGLPAGIPIAGGGGDTAARAVGMGAVGPGEGFVSLGTSGVLFVVSPAFRPNPRAAVHAFCHALPDRWHEMAVMMSAASALRWVTQLTGQPDEARLIGLAEALSEQAQLDSPVFLPYLMGERTPHNDPVLRASCHGLDLHHGVAHLGYAVAEGVAFGLLDGWHALNPATRAEVQALSVVGGGARSRFWARLLATVLDVPLVLREGGEVGGALGAARLAWLAVGGQVSEVCTAGPVRECHLPDRSWRERLMPRHARFRALGPAASRP